jgi:multiple sugar transport system permease protein/raffinose/stachyose/melibiose transport system permease protein
MYKMVKTAGLLNTYASRAYITVTLPVAIWMLRGFLMRVPRTLEEAAAVDGAKPHLLGRGQREGEEEAPS